MDDNKAKRKNSYAIFSINNKRRKSFLMKMDSEPNCLALPVLNCEHVHSGCCVKPPIHPLSIYCGKTQSMKCMFSIMEVPILGVEVLYHLHHAAPFRFCCTILLQNALLHRNCSQAVPSCAAECKPTVRCSMPVALHREQERRIR